MAETQFTCLIYYLPLGREFYVKILMSDAKGLKTSISQGTLRKYKNDNLITADSLSISTLWKTFILVKWFPHFVLLEECPAVRKNFWLFAKFLEILYFGKGATLSVMHVTDETEEFRGIVSSTFPQRWSTFHTIIRSLACTLTAGRIKEGQGKQCECICF